MLAQIAAETLGCRVEDIVVHSGDTDFTPFDKGAYASSTTYISGGAVRRAAQQVAEQIKAHAARMLGLDSAEGLTLREGRVVAPGGRSVTLEAVALNSLHIEGQHQIMASASFSSEASPRPL